uniref:ATP synthase mitochondrial F1 complex assembly factor 1 n=1 Tax=Babesia bovis TaxID=5865 RepID=S6BA82_BABBO|nr:conserved hypothetical protein [Babesia bovis]
MASNRASTGMKRLLGYNLVINRKFSFMYPVPRNLKDVAKVPLLLQCDAGKICDLWRKQFKHRNDVVTNVISGSIYRQLRHNINRSKMFIFPISVGAGSYNMFLQFSDGKSGLFTSVDAYKKLGIHRSPPYFILTLFDELLEQKDIVLVRGDIVNPKDVSKQNAERLMNLTIQFYTDINLYRWVDTSNNRPRDFQYDEFVRSCGYLLSGNDLSLNPMNQELI